MHYRRSGIQFSDDQKAVIKSLTESGRLAEAQTLILDELNKQYGGSAKAAAEADGGIQQLKNAIGDAKEEFGRYLMEALKPTIQGLKDFFSNLKARRYQAICVNTWNNCICFREGCSRIHNLQNNNGCDCIEKSHPGFC